MMNKTYKMGRCIIDDDIMMLLYVAMRRNITGYGKVLSEMMPQCHCIAMNNMKYLHKLIPK